MWGYRLTDIHFEALPDVRPSRSLVLKYALDIQRPQRDKNVLVVGIEPLD